MRYGHGALAAAIEARRIHGLPHSPLYMRMLTHGPDSVRLRSAAQKKAFARELGQLDLFNKIRFTSGEGENV